MGVVVDGASGLFAVIKKSGHSFIRPVDPLEQLILKQGQGVVGPDLFADTPHLGDDTGLANDVVNLIRAVSLVGSLVTPAMAEQFSLGLHRLQSSDQVARQIVAAILSGNEEMGQLGFTSIQQDVSTKLSQIGDLSKALEVLLVSLELDGGVVAHADVDFMAEEASDAAQLFSSVTGVSLLTESLKQMAQARFKLTRDLLLMEIIILEVGYLNRAPPSVSKMIHSTFIPRSVVMAHCYCVLVWLTETFSSAPPPNSL